MSLPRSLSIAIDQIARRAVGKDWNLYAALLDHWAEIVGPEYARLTTPVKITFPLRQTGAHRAGGTLTVRLPKGLAMEFTFRTGQICERITAYFGYPAVEKIAFETFYGLPVENPVRTLELDPAARAEIIEEAKDIEDDSLRDALEAFGEAVMTDAKKTV